MSAVSSPKVNIVTPVFISGGIWVKTDGFWGVFWKKKRYFCPEFRKNVDFFTQHEALSRRGNICSIYESSEQ
jgi:hypothetical protein